MSRVGKAPIQVPSGVQVSVNEGILVSKGPHGNFSFKLPENVKAVLNDNKVVLEFDGKSGKLAAHWGTARSIISSGIAGLAKKFEKKVDLIGVGYRANVQGSNLVMQLGYSHDITVSIPEGVTVICEKPTTVAISGADKQKVGQFAKQLQFYRPPEPYKGKGIIKQGQFVYRKEGKKK